MSSTAAATRRTAPSHPSLASTSRASTSKVIPPPLPYRRPSLPHRILYFFKLWAVKLLSALLFYTLRSLISSNHPPTFTKSYPSRPHLKHRFFFPSSGASGVDTPPLQNEESKLKHQALKSAPADQDGELFPLYINLHGGGFALCDAEFDDDFCATFSRRYSIAVINIEYSLTPAHRFPTGLDDVVSTALEVIQDLSLPIDTSRIVLGGFSAGGNLAIGAAQDARLRDWIKGVVAWYPVTDMTLSPRVKQATRRYRGWWDTDDFRNWGPVWNWALFGEGLDMRDPRVGVRWSRREDLPEWCCVLGAEYDMLCKEAKDMAEGWIGGRTWDGEVIEQGRISEEEVDGWERDGGRTKWMLKRNVRHGFTHTFTAGFGAEAQTTSKRQYELASDEIAAWLFRGAFK